MFWNSLWNGFLAFAHWETWIVVFTSTIAMFGLTFGGGLLLAKGHAKLATLWIVLLAPLVQVFVTLVAIMTLSPILFEVGDSAAWAWPWLVMQERPLRVIALIFACLVALVLIGLLGLGRVPGVTQLSTGMTTTASAASLIAGISPNLKANDLELWPGFLVATGFLIASIGFLLLAALLASAIAAILKIDSDESDGGFALLVMPGAAAVMFLPTFMYAAYLAPQLSRF